MINALSKSFSFDWDIFSNMQETFKFEEFTNEEQETREKYL